MSAEPLRTITGDGREITLPATIRGIREALPPERRDEFTEAVETAGVHDIHAVMRSWIMELLEAEDPGLRQDLDALARQEHDRQAGAA
ncbi:hypothetical protein [Streptomyces sp. RFCAC02]|uniref:hypothetical protein n=1 Tax=Streptomyces sp. RFCAC02 TaxID=2499143 RepID=UPI001021505F|nr:hypothetical protein [Streptomyces sp. RFCAC02]